MRSHVKRLLVNHNKKSLFVSFIGDKYQSNQITMRRLKIIRNVRTTLFVLSFLIVGFFCAGIALINYTGLPSSWRNTIENELAKKNIYVLISKLRYIPFRGIEATKTLIFSDDTKSIQIAQLERIVFDFDKTKAMRGIFDVSSIQLNDADIAIPVKEDDPKSELLRINNLNGRIFISNKNRHYNLSGLEGNVGNIKLKAEAFILGYRERPGYFDDDKKSGKHRELVNTILKEINQCKLDANNPPVLSIIIEADATKLSSLKATYQLSCPTIERDGITLKNISVKGNVLGSNINLSEFTADDNKGKFSIIADYDLISRSGNFDITSSFDIVSMIRSFTKTDLLGDVTLTRTPQITGKGTFSILKDSAPVIQAIGKISSENIIFRGSPLNSVSAEYSYDNHDLFLRDITIKHDQGNLTGKVLWKNNTLRISTNGDVPLNILRPFYRNLTLAKAIEGAQKDLKTLFATVNIELGKKENEPQKLELHFLEIKKLQLQHKLGNLICDIFIDKKSVTYELETSLPPILWKPFFPGQPLEKVFGDFGVTKNTEQYAKLKGVTNLITKKWNVVGNAITKNISYRGTPSHSASTEMDLSGDALKFTNVSVDFNYNDYAMRKSYDGAIHGQTNADAVIYDNNAKIVIVKNIRGKLYPAPLLRMFATSVADQLENYRFHNTPSATCSGTIGVKTQADTKLVINLRNSPSMDWEFLDKSVTLENPSSNITLNNQTLSILDTKCRSFGGDLFGKVVVQLEKPAKYNVDLNWIDLKLKDIASTYEFKEKGKGELTGSVNLSGVSGKTFTMSGNGNCKLINGELFSVPIFGPLSSVMAFTLNDKRAGFERAKEATATYSIKNGIILTEDFRTQTNSLLFTGNGTVNLNEQKLDMTIRMNARSLLGIIVLPLQPIIKGLFQFQGTGPIKKPKWEHVMFQNAPPSQETILKEKLLKTEKVESE
jgi:AsmA-like C-terminal region